MSTGASLKPQAQSKSRTRQIIYAVAIVALFGIMWPYSQHLSKVKAEADLGEATIGQIDEGSFVMKLAMIGGFRGIVANALWLQADELKREHEWDKLKAVVDMITKLQPHFLSVWTFQGWNLAYNVSVEWDAPEDKYTWIKNGIVYLRDGVNKNRKSPDLIWDTAWTYYHKLGMADEAIILRRLFHDDVDPETPDFREDPITRELRDDNFQVGKGWFTRAVRLVDAGNERVDTGVETDIEYVDKMPDRKGRPNDLNFRAMPAHAQCKYASALEKMSKKDIEPLFGQFAMTEWETALRDWIDFGTHPFPAHSHPDQMVYIGDIVNEKLLLSNERTDPQRFWTSKWSEQMHYKYWRDRCDAERETQGVEARRLFYEGTLALRTARYETAVEKYRAGLNLWKELLDRHPVLRDDDLNRADTGEIARRYVHALKQIGEEPPADMPFKDLYEMVKNDPSRDPFDQLDVMRVTRPASTDATK